MYWGNTSTASKIMKYIDRRLENLLSDLFLLTHIIHMHTYIRIYVCTYVYTYVIMHLRTYVRRCIHRLYTLREQLSDHVWVATCTYVRR